MPETKSFSSECSLDEHVIIVESVDNLGYAGLLQCLCTIYAGLGETCLAGAVYPCNIDGGTTGISYTGEGVNFCVDGNIHASTLIMQDACGGDVVSPLVSANRKDASTADHDSTVTLVAIRSFRCSHCKVQEGTLTAGERVKVDYGGIRGISHIFSIYKLWQKSNPQGWIRMVLADLSFRDRKFLFS